MDKQNFYMVGQKIFLTIFGGELNFFRKIHILLHFCIEIFWPNDVGARERRYARFLVTKSWRRWSEVTLCEGTLCEGYLYLKKLCVNFRLMLIFIYSCTKKTAGNWFLDQLFWRNSFGMLKMICNQFGINQGSTQVVKWPNVFLAGKISAAELWTIRKSRLRRGLTHMQTLVNKDLLDYGLGLFWNLEFIPNSMTYL